MKAPGFRRTGPVMTGGAIITVLMLSVPGFASGVGSGHGTLLPPYSGFRVSHWSSIGSAPTGCSTAIVSVRPQFNGTTGIGRLGARAHASSNCPNWATGNYTNTSLATADIGFKIDYPIRLGSGHGGVTQNWTLSFSAYEWFRANRSSCSGNRSNTYLGCTASSEYGIFLESYLWNKSSNSYPCGYSG